MSLSHKKIIQIITSILVCSPSYCLPSPSHSTYHLFKAKGIENISKIYKILLNQCSFTRIQDFSLPFCSGHSDDEEVASIFHSCASHCDVMSRCKWHCLDRIGFVRSALSASRKPVYSRGFRSIRTGVLYLLYLIYGDGRCLNSPCCSQGIVWHRVDALLSSYKRPWKALFLNLERDCIYTENHADELQSFYYIKVILLWVTTLYLSNHINLHCLYSFI